MSVLFRNRMFFVINLFIVFCFYSVAISIFLKQFDLHNALVKIVGGKSYSVLNPSYLLGEESPSMKIPLVLVICDDSRTKTSDKNNVTFYYDIKRQIEQFRVLLGTLLYFSFSPKWRVIVITDFQETFNRLIEGFKEWPSNQRQRLQLERYSTYMPNTGNISQLNKQYRPCNWQKIFLDYALPQEDAIIYADSDMIFMGPAEKLWNIFSKFNETQAIALAPEPWYVREDLRPYAGRVGLNMGIAVMNLTKLRNMYPKHNSFGHKIVNEMTKSIKKSRHDQDMVNQLLARRPHLYYELSYKWDFLPSDCTLFAPDCEDCKEDGITIVHGADASFYNHIEGKYLALYTVMKKMTRTLTTPADVLYYLLVATEEGVDLLLEGNLCTDFSFVPMITHHLRLRANITSISIPETKL